MKKLIDKLTQEFEKFRGFAHHWKSKGLIDSYYLNIRYADGIEHSVKQIERSIPIEKENGLFLIEVDGIKNKICESCLMGDHMSYGFDHRTGEEGRRDCKNISIDNQSQCVCTQDWPELYQAIEDKRKEIIKFVIG